MYSIENLLSLLEFIQFKELMKSDAEFYGKVLSEAEQEKDINDEILKRQSGIIIRMPT